MSRTFINQTTQISNSNVYNDTLTPSPSPSETSPNWSGTISNPQVVAAVPVTPGS